MATAPRARTARPTTARRTLVLGPLAWRSCRVRPTQQGLLMSNKTVVLAIFNIS